MLILGISCYFHDAAAALLRDGALVAAAEEERFTRIKHDFSFPQRAIEFCLRAGGIRAGDLDYVAFFEKPFVKFERLLLTSLQMFPRSHRVFREAMVSWLGDKLWIRQRIERSLGVPRDRILFSEHHLSHAASAFFCSPYDEAAILTVDGVGEWTTAALGAGKNTEIRLRTEIRFPHSLGLLYSAFTAFLGFEVNEGEYKVMGMAPFGQPRYQEQVYRLIRVAEDGGFELNMDYFSFHYSPEKTFNGRSEETDLARGRTGLAEQTNEAPAATGAARVCWHHRTSRRHGDNGGCDLDIQRISRHLGRVDAIPHTHQQIRRPRRDHQGYGWRPPSGHGDTPYHGK